MRVVILTTPPIEFPLYSAEKPPYTTSTASTSLGPTRDHRGAPLNEEFGKAVGADAYCRDAGIAVETAKTLIAARRAGAAA